MLTGVSYSAFSIEINNQPGALQIATVSLTEAITLPEIKQPTVKKISKEKKRRLVEGYRNSQHWHGSVLFKNKNHFTGYLYSARNKGSKIYVYGEIHQKQVIAYDSKGNLYQLEFVH